MENQYNYVTKLDIKFNHLEKIDVNDIIEKCQDKWFNQTLTKVNNSVVRIGIVEGEYHWHTHHNDDEFFFVLDGTLFVDIENDTFELEKYQGITITKGLLHRVRASSKTIILMVETNTIKPTGD